MDIQIDTGNKASTIPFDSDIFKFCEFLDPHNNLAKPLIGSTARQIVKSYRALAALARVRDENQARTIAPNSFLAAELVHQQIELPSMAEISSLIGRFPALNQFLLKRELKTLLRNLKVLDWIADCSVRTGTPDLHAWVGLADVIDWVWKAWVVLQRKVSSRIHAACADNSL